MKRIFIIIMTLALLSCAKSVDVQDNNFSVYDASGQTPKTIDVPADGQAEYKLRIMSGNNWILKISEGGEWISASLTSGPKGIREVTIDFAKNKEVVPRTGRMDFICASKTVSIAVKQEKGEEAVTPEPNDPPVTPPAPSGLVADILDVVFNYDGTASDKSPLQNKVEFIEGDGVINYYHDHYQKIVTHFSHKLCSSLSKGYYKIDFTDNQRFKDALADGHTLEIVFRMDAAPNGYEIKPFSNMQSGGTGFLITDSAKGMNLSFLPYVGSGYKWALSGIVPEVGKYYHAVGVWNKEKGTASIYVDGQLKNEIPASGEFKHAAQGSTWFCIGGDTAGENASNAFNGDVVCTRIYDKPLTAEDVTSLYEAAKIDAKTEVFQIQDIGYLSKADVAKGCWYYFYADGFKDGDKLILESTTNENSRYECETVFNGKALKLKIPDTLVDGKYRVMLKRGDAKYPIGYSQLRITDKIQSYNSKAHIVAHRGYHPGNIPENSIASLEAAQKLGVYGSELDVYITTDGVVVLYHDTTLRGTSDHADNVGFKGLRVDECTYEQLKSYKLCNGEGLPTLEDYVVQAKKYPKTKLILEIKGHNTSEKNMRVTKACYEIIKNSNMQDQVEYISFNYDICKKLVEYDPNAMVQYLAGNKKPADLFKEGIRGIDYRYDILTDEMIQSAHELGMTVNVWTVNSNSEIARFINKGVDLVTTDESELGMSLIGRPFVSYE
jgi:glycerophosphoryl diester phosphodiesterase